MKRSEQLAALQAAAILKGASRRGEVDDDYGAGKLTKHQKKSQEKHIGWTERDNSRGGKIKRALWG